MSNWRPPLSNLSPPWQSIERGVCAEWASLGAVKQSHFAACGWEETGRKGGSVFHAILVALCARTVTHDSFKLAMHTAEMSTLGGGLLNRSHFVACGWDLGGGSGDERKGHILCDFGGIMFHDYCVGELGLGVHWKIQCVRVCVRTCMHACTRV